MTKNILIKLSDEDYERLSKLKGDKTWNEFIVELVNSYQQSSQSVQKCEVDVDKIVNKILDVIERKIHDQLNPFTGKIDMVLGRTSTMIEMLEELKSMLSESKISEGSATQTVKEEKVVKKESKSEKKKDAIDYLREDKVTYESVLAKRRGYDKREARDKVFEKLERAGAIVFALKDERVAVDPDFWKRFVEKIQNITTNNENEIKKALTKKEYGLLVKMRESGLIWFDSTINRWTIEKELLAKTITKSEQTKEKEKRESGESVLSENEIDEILKEHEQEVESG